jgi:nucleotidyltransferase/DNA polymerase involved in DNA repair
MPIAQAYKKCPQGIYVPPNGRLYSQVSKEIFKLLENFTDQIEPLSIDEAFLDITGSISLFGSAQNIAEQLKTLIKRKQGLTASVGIAPNKFIAKIASDLDKPDGLVVVRGSEVQGFLNPLPLDKLWGAGEKTIQKLNSSGIYKVGDLARLPLDVLQKKFGSLGKHFYLLSRGIDDRPVLQRSLVKSVSNEHTFSEDTLDDDLIHETLLKLTEKVGYRLREKNLKGRTVHLKLRYKGFETITRNRTIGYPTDNTDTIFRIIQDLFKKNYQKERKIRLLGVGLSGFGLADQKQLSIFDDQNLQTSELDEIEDLIRRKFGKSSISRADTIRRSKDEDKWFE